MACDNLVNFRNYENDIRKRVVADLLPESELSLEQVYVPACFDLPNGERATQNVEQYLKTWLAEPGQRQLALLGEYGQGKSTTAQMLTYHLLQEASPTRLPILIELRGKSPRNLTPLQLLGAWTARYRIDPRALMELHSAGRLLLIFDGFDEMALVGDAEMRLRHFQSLWQFSHSQAKIVITGRANFFLDDQEMKKFLGISKPLGDGTAYCEALRLAPFELSQIERSLRAHKLLVREQICALAQRNDRFRELISRPSLLHIVSLLWEREKLADKVQELNSADIMELFVRRSYRRQGLKKADDPRNFMALTSLERAYFMSGVACYMAAEQLPNQIKKRELNQLIERLIKGIPDSVSTASLAIRGETRQPLRQRLANAPDRIEHVKTDVRACGLLVDDPALPDTFRFAHQSFMAYLFAAIVAQRIQKQQSEQTRALLKATSAKIEDLFTFSDSLPLDFVSELIATGYKKGHLPIYRDEKRRQAADQKRLAHRLLQSIAHQSFSLWGSLLLRFSLFNHAFLRSLKSYGILWRVIAYLLNPLVLVESAGLLALALLCYRHQSLTWGIWLTIFVLLTPFVTVKSMLIHLAYRNREWKVGTQLQRQMELWNRLCQQLNIPDQILHRVAGTWLLPWANKQPFDFRLRWTGVFLAETHHPNHNATQSFSEAKVKAASNAQQHASLDVAKSHQVDIQNKIRPPSDDKASPTALQDLNDMLIFREQAELVKLLLAMSSLANPDRRSTVIEALPTEIKRNIRHSSTDKDHIFNIVNTCLRYPNGMQELSDRLEFFEDNSIPMQRFKEALNRLLPRKSR